MYAVTNIFIAIFIRVYKIKNTCKVTVKDKIKQT